MWNSTISTRGAMYMCADAGTFYLATPLDCQEYMRIMVELAPQEFINANNLASKIKNGYIYMKLVRGIYGLPQAGVLANKLLKKQLEEYDYYKVDHTSGLFTHKTRPIWFTVGVDGFVAKYIGKQHPEHLMSVLKEHYDMEEDWVGELHYGINLSWNYGEGWVEISLPNYCHKQLTKYRHKAPKRPQYCPYEPAAVQYGRKPQETSVKIESNPLDKEGKLCVQQVVGSFLHYARAVDMTMLHALNSIAADSSKPTKRTIEQVEELLDYMHTNPTAVVRYHTSDMILNVHLDASYLSAGCGRSRTGGYFFLGSLPKDGTPIKLNGNIAITCAILKRVAASVAEATSTATNTGTRGRHYVRWHC
jgi:hypothetical protein